MRSSMIGVVFLCLVMGSGCQNEELIQCQQDSASLQGQLEDSQEQVGQAKTSGEQMASMLMAQMDRLMKDHKSEIKQVREQVKAGFDQRFSELHAQLTERTRELLEVQTTVKNKEREIKKINEALKVAREKDEKVTEMLQALGVENDKLKAQIAELRGQIEAEGTEAEGTEK